MSRRTMTIVTMAAVCLVVAQVTAVLAIHYEIEVLRGAGAETTFFNSFAFSVLLPSAGLLLIVGASFFVMTRSVIMPLDQLRQRAQQVVQGRFALPPVASGDRKQRSLLSVLVEKCRSKDLIEFQGLFEKMVQSLQEVISYLQVTTTEVDQIASQINSTAREFLTTSTEQSATVNQVGATASEMEQTSLVVADKAHDVLAIAQDAMVGGRRGINAVTEASCAMELIAQIADIVETVNDLAEQSNLLAVNASIEAAKAGEFGRGFSVVASEVRSLAIQSKKAARQIQDILQRTQVGRTSIASAKSAIEALASVLEDSMDKARQIASAAGQQVTAVKQIAEALDSLVSTSKYNAEGAGQLESTAQVLDGTIKELKAGLARFDV